MNKQILSGKFNRKKKNFSGTKSTGDILKARKKTL